MDEPEIEPVWWLPTFGFGLFVSLLLWMFASPSDIFVDPGVGRHLRAAEYILETGVIPHTDPLSFTHGGETWFDFEWAFETTLGELYRAGGLALVCAFCYGIFGATLLCIFRTLLQSKFSLTVVLLYTGLAFLTIHLHFAVRPVLFTYLFMAIVVEVWRRQPVPRKQDWLFLPIIFIAWANIHAGWLAALLFLGLSLFSRILDRIAGYVDGDEAPVIPWMGLTLVCALATCINPWGWALHHHVFLLATTYKSFALWDEYLPPSFSPITMSAISILSIVSAVFFARVCRNAPNWRWEALIPVLFFVYEGLLAKPPHPLLLATAALFVLFVVYRTRPLADKPRWRWEMLIPVLFFLYEGLQTQRHVLLLVIVAAVPVARDLNSLIQSKGLPLIRKQLDELEVRERSTGIDGGLTYIGLLVRERMMEFQARQRAAGGDAMLAIIALVVFTFLFLRTPIGHEIKVGKSVTPHLVAFLRDHPDRFQRPLTTTWNAGPLLWNMRPDFRVSMDDRGDFYGDPTVFAFVDMVNGVNASDEKAHIIVENQPLWHVVLDQGNYDSAILDPYLKLNDLLHQQPDWHEVYRDKHAVVYWREK
jgi:hypothetical protein